MMNNDAAALHASQCFNFQYCVSISIGTTSGLFPAKKPSHHLKKTAEGEPHSQFDVGRSMFDVHSLFSN